MSFKFPAPQIYFTTCSTTGAGGVAQATPWLVVLIRLLTFHVSANYASMSMTRKERTGRSNQGGSAELTTMAAKSFRRNLNEKICKLHASVRQQQRTLTTNFSKRGRSQIYQIFIHLNRFDGIIEICCTPTRSLSISVSFCPAAYTICISSSAMSRRKFLPPPPYFPLC